MTTNPSTRTAVKISATSLRRRWLAMWLLCGASLMIILDGTIVTVAMPTIQRSLGFSPGSLSWVMNAYLIAFGSLLLLTGRLGDLRGRKRVFGCGLAVFTAASLLCGLATSPAMLITARFAQGIGGAMVSAVSLGMIVTLFPEPSAQAKAIGAVSFVGAGGASLGLVLGGVLTQTVGWHWIFFVNVPIGIAASLLAIKVLDADQVSKAGSRADWLGAGLATAGLMLGVYAIGGTTQYGWGATRTLLAAALAIGLLAAFVIRQATACTPLLPLRIFSVRSVTGANIAQLLVIAAAFGFQVIVTLYLQRVLGDSAVISGLSLLPTAVVIGTVSLGFSARIAARFGHRLMLLSGLLLIAVALALLTLVPVHGSYPAHLLAPLVLFGAGGGLTLPALASLAMSAATQSDAGLASGLFNTTQQIGAALGVAVLSTLAATRTASLEAAGQGSAAALTSGYRLAFATGAGLAAAALIAAAILLRSRGAAPRPPKTTEPVTGNAQS
ncbi:MAG TPA: MFS transporter [Streptosporangiaceae bacterium]|nr:MFS transporter [Streptosporangiaceae bacterium]